MSPRRSVTAAEATRASVVQETVDRASLDGLEAVTIGRLAAGLGMSKAGVIGPFGSKERLQLAALQRAKDVFSREIWQPAASQEPGLARLEAIADAWLDYLGRDVFPGGCFFTQAACDFDGRRGVVRDAIEKALALWLTTLANEAAEAVRAGALPDIEPEQVAFELNAIAQGVNQARQLQGDERAIERGRRAMRRALYLD